MRHFSLTFRRICPIEWGLGYSYETFQIYPLILSHKVVIVPILAGYFHSSE